MIVLGSGMRQSISCNLVAECVKHFESTAVALESLDGFRYSIIDKPQAFRCDTAISKALTASVTSKHHSHLNTPG
jgi:hypothetical protein